jgi:xanthine dehydrogenase accessory factor
MDRRGVTGDARIGVVEAARAALDARAGGRAVSVVARSDSGSDGRRLLVYDDATRGTLGDAGLDAAGTDLGRELLGLEGSPSVERALTDLGATLYAECHRQPARLVIVGAGHIALPLARLGVELGFPVIVLDDREEFATEERFPSASVVLRVDFSDPFQELRPTASDSVVLVTRAHRYDYDCLHRLLRADPPPRYIGMVGSRRRVRAAFLALLDAGVERDALAAVHAPIGVDIGAETPGEIAVSIAAELVAVRRGVPAGGSLRDRDRVLERFLADRSPPRTSEPAAANGGAA